MATREFEAFQGYVSFDGVRINVDFEAPVGATEQEKDSAFVNALAQKAELNYLAIGNYTKEVANA
jgi:hypothetical protein